MKHAYFLVLPNTHLLDLAGPLQVTATLKELGIADVSVECIGPRAVVQSYQRVTLTNVHPLPARLRPGAVLFVVGGKLDTDLMKSRAWLETVAWLRKHFAPTAPDVLLCGICTGAFLVAEAGLLESRWCTTHHHFVRLLRRRHPAVHVAENRLFVRDRNVWTSAGVASGIDLALHVVAEFFGEQVAIQVARENVVQFRRFSGDPALTTSLRYRAHCNSRVHALQDAIARDLTRKTTYEELARALGCSGRHLARQFVAETGITIKQFQIESRLDLARRLLIESTLPLEDVAERCGFRSIQAFRANWNQHEAMSPSALRRSRRSRRTSDTHAAGLRASE